ncbi:MAG: hypothetical protein U1E56_04180 [Bauldia sp.]
MSLRNIEKLRATAYSRFVATFCVVFVPVYALGIWRGAAASHPLVIALDWERAWPLWPWMVVPYVSLLPAYGVPLFVLPEDRFEALTKQSVAAVLISGAVFLVLPTTHGFPPDPPIAEPFAALFQIIRSVGPHNLFPSLHVAGSSIVLLASAEAVCGVPAILLRAWIGLIAASTLFVHEHHLADVAAGLALALLIRRAMPIGGRAR